MLTRRSLLLLSVAAAGLAMVGPHAVLAQSDPTATATAFVQRTGSELIAIVNSSASLPEKQKKLAPIIDETVDVDGIAQFCLGRYWRTATPEQQQAYKRLFHTVLLNSITGKLGDYTGVKFTMGRAQVREDGVVVSTTIQRPNNAPNAVDWVVSTAAGGPKIIDTVAEGTSLRLTQRSDYASYLAHNNNDVQALIDAMRRQVNG